MDGTFPSLRPNPSSRLITHLLAQIYTIDNLLTSQDCGAVLAWAKGLEIEGPKRAGKGEAERTGRRTSLDSATIASTLLSLLLPHLPHLSPSPLDPQLLSNIRVYHYPPSTYFRSHYDSPQLDPSTRRLSCWTVLIYLSEGVVGGGTTFHPDDGAGTKKSGRGTRGDKGKGMKDGIATKGKKGAVEVKRGGATGRSITVEPRAGRALLH